MASHATDDQDVDEKAYLSSLKNILCMQLCSTSTCLGPAQLLDHLYIGNLQDAQNTRLLKRLRVTHVVNCAGLKDYSRHLVDNPYGKEMGIKYLEFEAYDNDGYPILMHFSMAKSFIDQALKEGGRALVHCQMGVNRSGAICTAYLMMHEGITLLQAVRRIKMERKTVLVNEGFQKQLITFARERHLLIKKKN